MRCCRGLLRAALAAAAFVAAPALAHKASDAYLQLRAAPTGVELRWDIALRDLDAVVDLDADGDSRLTWREIKAAWPAIDAYALPRLSIAGCNLKVTRRGLERRSDGAYAVLWLEAPCALPAEPALGYALFAEVDPTHRGILKIERPGEPVRVRSLDPTQPPIKGAVPAAGASSTAPSLLREGVHHIVTGYDHVLFLLCLLLPAPLRRTSGGWRPVASFGQAAWPVAGVVTAFTVAHSMTLALAATGVATLPPWFVEPAIALTIVAAALDNLVPIFGVPRGAVAFAFGLIHGFGFAGVLAELELPTSAFAWALLQFNLGLEAGQLAIVAVVVALLYAARRWRGYPRWVIGAGSVAAVTIGALWFVERATGMSPLSF